MCLAPCFKGCTDAEYSGEVERVEGYFNSGGQSLERQLASERDAASANLAFEDAAALHARIEKVHSVTSQLPEIVHRIDRLNGLIIQPSHESDAVAFFRVKAGVLSGPISFSIEPEEHAKSQSMESRIEGVLATVPAPSAKSSTELMEHIALLKRWYFRSSRIGEIFFADEHGDLPMRRVVRAISRVYRGEKPEAQPGPQAPAPDAPITPQ